MKAIQCLSPRAFPPPSPRVSSPSPRSQTSVFFRAGRVSPVRADSSISRETASIRRMSAGTRSPTEKVTRSPGKRALASGVRGRPSLRHLGGFIGIAGTRSPNKMAVVRDKLCLVSSSRNDSGNRHTLLSASSDFSDLCSWTKPTR